ncbi:MAG: carboxypeptidase-like regulatory domain-containing protein, partial [Acidobacteriota bacterium]
EGTWLVDLLTLGGSSRSTPLQEVKIRPGKSFAEVEIVLPDGELAIEAQNSQGELLEQASVIVFREDGSRLGTGLTDSDGVFRLEGVESGDYTVDVAQTPLSSGLVHFTMKESRKEAHREVVVLREAVQVEGQVLDASRQPVAGAWVLVRPYSSGGLLAGTERRARTEASGAFELEMEKAPQYEVLVLGAGRWGFYSRSPRGPWLLELSPDLRRVSFSIEAFMDLIGERQEAPALQAMSGAAWPFHYFSHLESDHTAIDESEVHVMHLPEGSYRLCAGGLHRSISTECTPWAASY